LPTAHRQVCLDQLQRVNPLSTVLSTHVDGWRCRSRRAVTPIGSANHADSLWRVLIT